MFHHNPMNKTPLINLQHVSLVFGEKRVLDDITWSMRPGEQWAVIGHNGAGKTSLLKLLRGEVRPYRDYTTNAPVPVCTWGFSGEPDSSPLAVRPVSSLLSSELQRHYVRQRWQLRGEEVVLSGFGDGYMLYDEASDAEKNRAYELAASLGATYLLDAMAPDLSQGQLRLLLLARALVKRPKLLLLDEPADGLDAQAQKNVYAAVEEASRQGCGIVCAIHRDDDLPECITHVLELEQGRIVYSGKRDSRHGNASQGARLFANEPTVAPHSLGQRAGTKPDEMVFAMRHADVYLQRKRILHDINWEVRTGQQWLLSGPNGSGKTTLLRVLLGQEHVALGGSLSWFGMQGQPTLDERKKYTGYISDWLRNNYHYDLTGRELVLSGLHGTIGLYRESSPEESEEAQAVMEVMGLTHMADQHLDHMSEGTARRFLLARALAPRPRLLILDEPCSGLDAESRKEFLGGLPFVLERGTQIIFVSHSSSDLRIIDPFLTHELRLHHGEAVFCGPRPECVQLA